MDQIAAFEDTVRLAESRRMPELPGNSLGLDHLREMLSEVKSGQFEPGKLGRWLGWAQCAAVAADIGLTLEDMRIINIAHMSRK